MLDLPLRYHVDSLSKSALIQAPERHQRPGNERSTTLRCPGSVTGHRRRHPPHDDAADVDAQALRHERRRRDSPRVAGLWAVRIPTSGITHEWLSRTRYRAGMR